MTKKFSIKIVFLALFISLIYLDLQGFFLNQTYSDVVDRLTDFRQHSFHYYMGGNVTTNNFYQEYLNSSPAFLPKIIAFLSKSIGSFDYIFIVAVIFFTSLNIIALPYFVYTFTRKKFLFISLMCLMPTFSISLAPDGPIVYGHGITPATGYIGMNLIILLLSSILNNKNIFILLLISLLIFIVHPVIFALLIPLLFLNYKFFHKNNLKIIFRKKINFFIIILGFIWPLIISVFLSFYKNTTLNYSNIVSWMSMHNFFIGYESFIIIFGFLSIIYGLKIISDYLLPINPLASKFGFLTALYGVGIFLFNLIFLESHIINIASLIMPLRYESFMIIVLFALIVSLIFSNKSLINDFSKFCLSFYIAFCFYLTPGIYGQRGLLLYFSPIALLIFLHNEKKLFKLNSRSLQIILFFIIFLLFLIFVPSSKDSYELFSSYELTKNYIFERLENGFKFFIFYTFLSLIMIFGLIFRSNNLKKNFINFTSINTYNFLNLFAPILFIVSFFNFNNLKNYLSSQIFLRNKEVSSEEKVINFISNNLNPEDAILQHPELPFFRRALPHYFSLDLDLISIIPYAPHYIKNAMCELDSTYRINSKRLINSGQKSWHIKNNAFRSQINWLEIKKYHIKNKELSNLSYDCKNQNYKFKSFKYIIEPIKSQLVNNQVIIFSNGKYRITQIVR